MPGVLIPISTGMAATAGTTPAVGNTTPVVVQDPASPIIVSPHTPPVPAELVGRIWKGEFIKMDELLPEALRGSLGQAKEGKKRKREQIRSPQQWVECFHTFVAVVILKEPQRAGDLLAYASLITHYSRQFKGSQWRVYDTNFRLQAAATRPEKWAEVNSSLWAMAFGGAEWQKHCRICSSLDHGSQDCPRTPDTASKGKFKAGPEGMPQICTRYNYSSCSSPSCGYQHNLFGVLWLAQTGKLPSIFALNRWALLWLQEGWQRRGSNPREAPPEKKR